jgi:CheY-like chemotaxis protein
MSKRKILIIEDDIFLSQILAGRLQKEGFDTENFLCVDEDVIDKVIEVNPDLISMDIFLPGTNGLEATKILKADSRTSKIPIYILSNSDIEHDKDVAISYGAEKFICKAAMHPIDLAKLFKTYFESDGSYRAPEKPHSKIDRFAKLQPIQTASTFRPKEPCLRENPKKNIENLKTIIIIILLLFILLK